MNFLEKMERRFGGFFIPHLTEILIFGQVVVWFASSAEWLDLRKITLVPALVLAGDASRLVTFLFIPPAVHPVFLIFAWIFFFFMGTALETQWGEFRYNLFIFAGYAATVAVSFLSPAIPATNAFIGTSIFLAFAFLYPDYVIYIFLIVPVRIKWVAAFTWASYALGLVGGSWPTRLNILASISNILIFFGGDLWRLIKAGGRRAALHATATVRPAEPFHRCAVCGITEQSHPDMSFRYCSGCRGEFGYCADHIRAHEHK